MRFQTLAAVFVLPAIALAQTGAAALPAPGNVALPLDEYNRLVDLAGKVAKKPEAPPAAYAVKSAVLKLQAGNESVTGTIDLEGEVFAKQQTSVPLVSGMTIFEAQRQGRELPLEQAASSTEAVLAPGDFAVTLRAGLPLRIEAGSAAFNLPVPAAGSVLLTLTIPATAPASTSAPEQDAERSAAAERWPGLLWSFFPRPLSPNRRRSDSSHQE